MRKIIFGLCVLVGFFGNAQQLLEVLKSSKTRIPFVDTFIPDENCNELVYDKHFGDGKHDFIYCAKKYYQGGTWITLNLGSEYANVHSPHFNPKAVPTGYNDWKAYGSLFQQGRRADGHELTEYEEMEVLGSKIFVPKNLTDDQITTEKQDPYNSGNKFYTSINNPEYNNVESWWGNTSIEELKNMWGKEKVNDPCPIGYHVPTNQELESMVWPIIMNPVSTFLAQGAPMFFDQDWQRRIFLSPPVRSSVGRGSFNITHPHSISFDREETGLWTSTLSDVNSCYYRVRDYNVNPREYCDEVKSYLKFVNGGNDGSIYPGPYTWRFSNFVHWPHTAYTRSMAMAIRCKKDVE